MDENQTLEEVVEACGQSERLCFLLRDPQKRSQLREALSPVERFYRDAGGVVGYQKMMLRLLRARAGKKKTAETMGFLPPKVRDITHESADVKQAVLEGIFHLPLMGEIYVVGGAGDRLALIDEVDQQPLPAAKLKFLGKTLLQGLIEDVQGREYCYFKMTGKKIVTPIAIMTSEEKENHRRILKIMEDNNWFGRPRSSFRLFTQPLVPVMDAQGEWCLSSEGNVLLKPGGHGVIWKLAEEEGVFDWFASQGRTKALVRQVNNPVAGVDYGLLALCGIGFYEDQVLGFASCARLIGSQEGMNVLIEKKGEERVITNVEYCSFSSLEIEDDYSKFPSNTNILFVDLEAVRQAVKKIPLPGMLVNLKKATYFDESGSSIEGEVARLETTMQNIADVLGKESKTFLTYNKRRKTISCAKRKYDEGGSLLETPEGAFLDVLKNNHELLSDVCGWDVFSSFLFWYPPALGPLYSIIAQKLKKGRLSEGSELDLQITEVDLEGVVIDGSVAIVSETMEGKCRLKNVTIRNQGVDHSASNIYWKKEITHLEQCKIIIKGSGEFCAEDVTFSGNQTILVEDGERLLAKQKGDEVCFERTSLAHPYGYWHYAASQDNSIVLVHKKSELC